VLPEETGAEIALMALAAHLSPEVRRPIVHVVVQPDVVRRPRAAVVQMLAAMPPVRCCTAQGQGDALLLTLRRETDAMELELARHGTNSVRTLVRMFGGEADARPVLIDAAGERLRVSWKGLEAWLTGYSGDGAFSHTADDPDEELADAGVRAVVRVGLLTISYTSYEARFEPE
jgi:hypothetical protein